ncbi:MAG TPA: class I SAM-dependent methyltransferase [Propionicimonas sp.]|jgi:SAM-dependent methyltransferase
MPGDDAVRAYYERSDEAGRLKSDSVELLRTRELLATWLPHAPAEVLDVGGGAGIHALWLAGLGYTVDLVDAMPGHVEQAVEASRLTTSPLRSAEVGDARALARADASVDAVLLLGPLYHLTAAADRQRALAEALRVLRPGGVAIAAGISRWASTADGLMLGYLGEEPFPAIVAADVATGVHRNPDEHPHWFTTAYFHTPEELAADVADAGFEVDGPVAVEGPWPVHPDLLDGAAKQEAALAAIRRLERDPSVLGGSPHLLVRGRKPE